MTSLQLPVTADPQSQGVFAIHLHSSAYSSRKRIESEQRINAAVQVLRRKHRLKDASAYALLVRASSDARLSLEDTARNLLEELRGLEGLGIAPA